jgi:RarD protein
MNPQIKVVIAMLLFGSMGLCVRNIDLPSSTIALIRGMIGVLFLALISITFKKQLSIKAMLKNGWLLLISGITLSANWIFIFEAYHYTTISTATLSYYLAPVFVIALSPLILKEKITPLQLLCIATSLLGMLLVSGVLTNSSQGTTDLIGISYGMAAAISYASLTLLNKFTKELSSMEATIGQLGVSSLILLPYTFLTTNVNNITIGMEGIILLIILGVAHTGLGFWLYFSSVQELKAQTVATFSYIDPVTAILLSALFLHEQLGPTEILGAILILSSTLLCEIKPSLSSIWIYKSNHTIREEKC